jgi:hypothetical protein
MTDYFTKWLGAYTTPSQDILTVAEALVTNSLCDFGVLQKYTETRA